MRGRGKSEQKGPKCRAFLVRSLKQETRSRREMSREIFGTGERMANKTFEVGSIKKLTQSHYAGLLSNL